MAPLEPAVKDLVTQAAARQLGISVGEGLESRLAAGNSRPLKDLSDADLEAIGSGLAHRGLDDDPDHDRPRQIVLARLIVETEIELRR
jgi:hypothetical protein